ncbi:MAG: FtsX-like permease family protein [Clostridiales bacterium]|nr:FtsX-like permease family protein [Clostridiales bacterium]
MKVNSRKALSRLSLRSLLASKKQNIITVFAIILTTVLFTTLFTTFISLRNTLNLQQMKDYGDSSYAIMAVGDEDELESLRGLPGVKDVGVSIELGYTPDKTFVAYCDQTASGFVFSVPSEGHLPSSPDEVVMSRAQLQKIGSDASIGDQVTVDYVVYSSDREVLVSDTFTLSGITSDDSHYILVSEDYARDVISDLSENIGMYLYAHLDFLAGSEFRVYDIAEELGLDPRCVLINPAFESSSDPLGPEGIAAVVVLMLLIFFTGFLIIYNIFQITVANKVRDYGLLKTVGVTSKQIRKIIRKQSAFLCIIGVPIGLIAGYLIGVSMVPVLLRQTVYGAITPVSGFNILVFLGAAAVSVITVLISSSVPGRKASKVSPIDALRYNEAKVSVSKREKVNASIPSMSFANLGRNRMRTFLVVLSISLALVLFDTLCTFIDNFDMNDYIQSHTPSMDFTVSTPSYFAGEHDDYLTLEEVSEISSHIESDHCGIAYMPENFSTYVDGRIDYPAQVVGVENELLSEVDIIEGDISSMYEDGTASVIATANSSLHIGDTVSVTFASDYHYRDPRTGTVYESPNDVPQNLDFYDLEMIPVGGEKEYRVCAITEDYPSSFSPLFIFADKSEQLILNEQQIDDLTDGHYSIMCFCADAVSSEAAAEAEAYLHELAGSSSHFDYTSIETVREDFDQFLGAVKYIGGFLCGIVGIIAVLNFINAILTGIISRKREFALLQAVGMTGRQLRKMLVIEGLFYAAISVLFSLPFALLVNTLFKRIDLFWSPSTAHLTVVPILILLPVLALLGSYIPCVIYGKVRGTSIVDDRRTNE